MTVEEILDWAIGLIPRYLGMLASFEFAEGVNVLSFNIALWIMLIIIVVFGTAGHTILHAVRKK